MSERFAGMKGKMVELMRTEGFPHWLTNFDNAAEQGRVKLLACSAMTELFDMKLQKLEPCGAGYHRNVGHLEDDPVPIRG